MKRRYLLTFLMIALIGVIGCGQAAQNIHPTETPAVVEASATLPPTADVQATVDAAIAGTSQAQASIDATVEAAVSATVAAAMIAAPVPESETAQAEEVEQAVTEVQTATDEIDEAVVNAVADEALSSEEIAELESLLSEALIAFEYAIYLAETYEQYYAYVSNEEIQELYALVDDLEEIEATLNEILALLETGSASAQEILSAIESSMIELNSLADSSQINAVEWQAKVQALVEQRLANIEAIQPNVTASDRSEALNLAQNYIATMQDALTDNQFSPEELAQIAQSGANASSGLQQQGGPLLSKFAGNIDQLTASAASGQFGQVQMKLNELRTNLPARP